MLKSGGTYSNQRTLKGW